MSQAGVGARIRWRPEIEFGQTRRRSLLNRPSENQDIDAFGATAQQRARAAALTVAPEVKTSSKRTIARPSTLAPVPSVTRNAPCILRARCERESPTWDGVALTRARSP